MSLATLLDSMIASHKRVTGGPPGVIRLRSEQVVRLAKELEVDPRDLERYGPCRLQLDDRMPEIVACR